MNYIYKKYKTPHEFVSGSHFKLSGRINCYGAIIDNRKIAPIFVLDENDRINHWNCFLMVHVSWNIFTGLHHVIIMIFYIRYKCQHKCGTDNICI